MRRKSLLLFRRCLFNEEDETHLGQLKREAKQKLLKYTFRVSPGLTPEFAVFPALISLVVVLLAVASNFGLVSEMRSISTALILIAHSILTPIYLPRHGLYHAERAAFSQAHDSHPPFQ